MKLRAGQWVEVTRPWYWYRPLNQRPLERDGTALLWSRRPNKMEAMPVDTPMLVLRAEGTDLEFLYQEQVYFVTAGELAHIEKDFRVLPSGPQRRGIEHVDLPIMTVERLDMVEVKKLAVPDQPYIYGIHFKV